MKITIAQQNYTVADVRGNVAKIIATAQASTAPVVVFPEGAITGAPLLGLDLEAATARALDQITAACPSKELLIGLDDFQIAYIAQGEIQIIDNDSILLDNTAIHFGKHHFAHHAPAARLSELKAAATNDQQIVIGVNQVGASTDTVYYGGSMVCYPSGSTITLPLWSECVTTIDTIYVSDAAKCDTTSATDTCECRAETLSSRKTDASECDQKSASDSCKCVCEAHKSDWGSDIEQTHQAIVLAIRDYFAKNNFQQACIALSGGIDSAIVVALAVEALGADRVVALLLPSAYSSDHSVTDSLEMVSRCGIRHHIIEIKPIVEQALTALEPIFRDTQSGLAEENIQSRIRLMLTMALCNKTGALMLNTSNKSEIAVGYGTLYGDTSGALGVIGDLYKTEVYELARHINKVAGDMIPQNIIDKEPSAELRPNQLDSDSLPPYDTLDAILEKLVEQRLTTEQIIAQGYDPQAVTRTARLLWNADFKRQQLPPSIRLSGMTFGLEYVMPITKTRYFEQE